MTRRAALFAFTSALRKPATSAEWMRLDVPTARLRESTWTNADRAIAPGSLLKPFVALAFGAAHDYRFPSVQCARCWKPDGHGRISLIDAVAFSCNTYFLELARASSLDDIARIAAAYGLNPPSSGHKESWIGLGADWSVQPFHLARAYAELASRAGEIGPKLILQGMRESARRGTARAVNSNAYAKTGTGPCAHERRGSGDGFVVALYAQPSPQHVLLLRVHDQPGFEAARAAGRLIGATS